jgi:uncharacterized protein YndB with AHSA1/START domain
MIHATPETVFRFFTDSERWAKWWGAGSTIEPRPGGRVYIRHPEGTESLGEVLEVAPPRRLVFTYGFATGTPIAAGGSRVTIDLTADRAGTRLQLTHDMPSAEAREEHLQGWRFQLSLFANIVANEMAANAATLADQWFQAWGEPDAEKRTALLGRIASPDLRVQDRYSSLDGLDDVLPHLAAAQRFMPGITMRRVGEVRHCQGMVLCDWTATKPDGQQVGKGTNAFVLDPTGKIEGVTGFWG